MSALKQLTKKQKLLLFGITGLAIGLGLISVIIQKTTRVTPKAEQAPQATLSFVDKTPNSNEKVVDLVVTVTDPAINDPDSGAGINTVTTTINYSGSIENITTSSGSVNNIWNITLSNNNDGATLILWANQNVIDQNSTPIKGTAVLGTINFTLTGQSANLSWADDAFIDSLAAGTGSLVIQKENLTYPTQPADGASLKLIPSSSTINPQTQNTLSVDVVLDTNNNPVGGVETVLLYDNALISIEKDQNDPPIHYSFGAAFTTNRIDIVQNDSEFEGKGRITINSLLSAPENNQDSSPDPVNGPNIKIATLNFDILSNAAVAHLLYLCETPVAVGDIEYSPSYTCEPLSDYGSNVALYDSANPNYRGEDILVLVENGEYTIQEPDAPTNTPTPIATNTPTQTPAPTNTPVPTQTPAPTATPQPGSMSVKINLQACNSSLDNLSRKVKIWIDQQQISGSPIQIGQDGTTGSFPVSASTPFQLAIMPEGYLPIIFNNVQYDSNNQTLNLANYPFTSGNADGWSDPVADQTILTSDFTQFKIYLGNLVSENPQAINADFNCSGKVNVLDYTSILLNWGEKTQTVNLQ